VLAGVSGKGLLIGLEFPSDAIGYQFAGGLFRRGVLVAGTYSKARTIRLEPSLGIPMDLLQEVLNRIEDTFREIVATRRDA
jgi:putrescine aminotransferase